MRCGLKASDRRGLRTTKLRSGIAGTTARREDRGDRRATVIRKQLTGRAHLPIRSADFASDGFEAETGNVAKPEWGQKRTCTSCGAKFYDMQRDPIICPSCGTKFVPQDEKPRRARAEAKAPKKKAAPPPPAEPEEDEEIDEQEDSGLLLDDDDENAETAEDEVDEDVEAAEEGIADVAVDNEELDDDDDEADDGLLLDDEEEQT